MGLDIYVDKNLVLKSGKLYRLGTVELPDCGLYNLLNPELWYQKECFFLDNWCKKNLDPVVEDSDEEYKLTRDGFNRLIVSCNTVLQLENQVLAGDTKQTKIVESIFSIDGYLHRYSSYNERFFTDVRKLRDSMEGSIVPKEIDDPDIKFTIIISR